MVILRNKNFSKESREKVPEEVAKKAKEDSVIQEYKGSWRIVSFKTNPPTFWNSHYTSKSSAQSALKGYWVNK